jgi:hypothetical protein
LDDETRRDVEALIENASQAHEENDLAEMLNIIDAIALLFDGGHETEHASDEYFEQLVVDAFDNGSEGDLAAFINQLDRASVQRGEQAEEE